MGLGFGAEEEQLFGQYEYRPAFHDLLDPAGGYVSGAEIDFMNLTLRQYEGRGVELERLTPIRIRSVAARDRFVKPISWKIETNVERKRVMSRRGTYAYTLHGGPGIAYPLLQDALLFGFTDVALEYSTGYGSGGSAGGIGGMLGASVDLGGAHRLLAEFEAKRFAVGEDYTAARAELGWSVSLGKRYSLRLVVSRQTEFERYFTELYGALYAYL